MQGEKMNRAPLRAVSVAPVVSHPTRATHPLLSLFHLVVAVNVTGNLEGPV